VTWQRQVIQYSSHKSNDKRKVADYKKLRKKELPILSLGSDSLE
jgi:hypothetical protein